MTVRLLRFCLLLLVVTPLVDAQQAANDQDEMRFVDAMRKQGYPDLALQYLEGLKKKGISKELAAELPVEIAKTQLALAIDEADSAKKLAVYADVRAELQKFLKANPQSRLAPDVELSVAEVAVLQGRTALTQAVMFDEGDTRETPERQKARGLLEQAGKELAAVEKKLAGRVKAADDSTPAGKAQKARLEATRRQAQFDVALNYFDQATSFARNGKRELLLERSKRIDSCAKELQDFVGLEDTNPLRWRALAWLGRCLHEQGELPAARARFAAVRDVAARNPAAFEAGRLASYFRLLVIDEKAEANENQQQIIEAETALWLRNYPRAVNTPEGCGIRFLQAKYLLLRAGAAKDAREKSAFLTTARRVLSSIESTENDFTDRARRKKVQIIGEQGTFQKAVADLKTFEDCYVRSQFEQYELEKEEEKLTGDALKSARTKRQQTIAAALERGLGLPDAKEKGNLHETNNARAMLAFCLLNDGKYAECVKVGEDFARNDPRSGQATRAAAYALQAYAQMPKKTPDDLKKLADFATYCKERWKKELPGNLGRHQLALVHAAAGKGDEVIAELEAITTDYPTYAATQLLLVDTASNLARADDQKADHYRGKMMAALERVTEPAPLAGTTAQAYFLIRCRLADEMFNTKKFDRMDAIARPLEEKLPTVTFTDDKAKNDEMRTYFTNRLVVTNAYSAYGKANDAMTKNDPAKVGPALAPIIAGINDKKMDALKSNLNLANAILNLEMKASIGQNQLDRTRRAVQAYQAINDEGGDVPPVLKQLVGLIRTQIDELRKKGNPDAVGNAVLGFSAILDDLTKKQEKASAEFYLLTATCYTSLDQFGKAVELLQKVAEPPAGTDEKDRAVLIYREAQIQTVRAYRLEKKFDEANAAMKAIMAEKGWGRRNLGALKEQMFLYLDQDDFASAHSVASQVSAALVKPAERDAKLRGEYIDAYYHMTYSLVRLAANQKQANQRKVALDNAARAVVDLEKRYPDLGGDESARRYKDLLATEADLQKAYDDLKKK